MPILNSLYNTLTRKVQTANKDITREIVEDWVGNAGSADRQIAFMTGAFTALYCVQYSPDKMVEDILHSGHLDN